MVKIADISSLKVKDLQAELKKRSLKPYGKKTELQKRLREAILKENAAKAPTRPPPKQTKKASPAKVKTEPKPIKEETVTAGGTKRPLEDGAADPTATKVARTREFVPDRIVRVSGLPEETRWRDIKDFMKTVEVEVAFVSLDFDSEGNGTCRLNESAAAALTKLRSEPFVLNPWPRRKWQRRKKTDDGEEPKEEPEPEAEAEPMPDCSNVKWALAANEKEAWENQWLQWKKRKADARQAKLERKYQGPIGPSSLPIYGLDFKGPVPFTPPEDIAIYAGLVDKPSTPEPFTPLPSGPQFLTKEPVRSAAAKKHVKDEYDPAMTEVKIEA